MVWFILGLCIFIANIFTIRKITSKWDFQRRKWAYANFWDNVFMIAIFSIFVGVILLALSIFINDGQNLDSSVLFWISLTMILWFIIGSIGLLAMMFALVPLAMFLIWFFEVLFLYCVNLEKDDLDAKYHWDFL